MREIAKFPNFASSIEKNMSKVIKTNALRILDKNKINYESKSRPLGTPDNPDKDAALIHKTLVAHGMSKEIYVFIIPTSKELDLKKAATATHEKKILMLHEKELLPNTGYIKGGCSPIGMKKQYKTFLEISSADMNQIIVSGGKVKFRVKLNPKDLIKVVNAKAVDLIK